MSQFRKIFPKLLAETQMLKKLALENFQVFSSSMCFGLVLILLSCPNFPLIPRLYSGPLNLTKFNHQICPALPASASKLPVQYWVSWITHMSGCRSCFCSVKFNRHSETTMGKAISLTPSHSPQMYGSFLLVLRKNMKYSPWERLDSLYCTYLDRNWGCFYQENQEGVMRPNQYR